MATTRFLMADDTYLHRVNGITVTTHGKGTVSKSVAPGDLTLCGRSTSHLHVTAFHSSELPTCPRCDQTLIKEHNGA